MIRINEFFCDNLWRDLTNYTQGTNYQEIEYRDRDKLPYNSQISIYDELPVEFYKGKLSGKQLIPIDDGEHAEEINFIDRINKIGKSIPIIHHKMNNIINIANE